MRRHVALVALAAMLAAPTISRAQDAGVPAPTGPAAAGDASTAPVAAPLNHGQLPPGHAPLGPVDPNAQLPPGHPPMGGGANGHGGGSGGAGRTRMASLPPVIAEEAQGIPPGTIEVRVVNAAGTPVPEAQVRIGTMRNGEPGPSREARTAADGTVRVGGLATGEGIAYRVSTDHHGARSGAPPFMLPTGAGYRVQLVRFETESSGRGVFLWNVWYELRFKDDRLVVTQRFAPVNVTAMEVEGETARPVTYVPENGIRIGLPRGYTAFNVAPMMSDMRLVAEGDAAVLRGSIPPTMDQEPTEVAFQYQVKLDGDAAEIVTTLPLPAAGVGVVSEAPPGLRLSVDGMGPAQEDRSGNQRVLVTRTGPEPVMMREVRIRLTGIPSPTGPERWLALGAVVALMGGAVVYGVRQRRRGRVQRSRATVSAERDRVLAEMEDLVRAHRDGEVGPATYERRRRELAMWLATLLRELDTAR